MSTNSADINSSGAVADVPAAGERAVPAQMLGDMAGTLLRARDLRGTLAAAVGGVARGLRAGQAVILGHEESGPHLRILARASRQGSGLEVSVPGPLSLPPAAAGDRGPKTDPGGWFAGGRATGWISSPLAVGGSPFGMICVLAQDTRRFSDQDNDFLQAAAGLVNAALVRLREESRDLAAQRALNEASVRHVLHILGQCLVHELRQPMTAALGYLFSCRHVPGGASIDAAAITDLQEKATAELQRLKNMLGDARTHLENQEYEPAGEDLDGVIGLALSLLRDEIESLHIRINYEPGSRMPKVRLDRIMGLQLIFNLLRACIDALRYSVRREISVSTRCAGGGYVELCITHTGHTLHEDFLNNPYVTGCITGAGLKSFNLAICRYIIDTHCGGCRLSSVPGRGYGFTIILPLHEHGDTVTQH